MNHAQFRPVIPEITTETVAADLVGEHLHDIAGYSFELDTSGNAANYRARNWWVRGAVRVVLDGFDGVEVHCFTNRSRNVLQSTARFDANVNAYAVLKFIAAVVS